MLFKVKVKFFVRGLNKLYVVKFLVKMFCYFFFYRYKYNFELLIVIKVVLNFSYVYRVKIVRMLDIIYM